MEEWLCYHDGLQDKMGDEEMKGIMVEGDAKEVRNSI